MVVWTIVMAGIILIGVVVVFQWKECKAGHISYGSSNGRPSSATERLHRD